MGWKDRAVKVDESEIKSEKKSDWRSRAEKLDEDSSKKILSKPESKSFYDVDLQGLKEGAIQAIPAAVGTAGAVAGGMLAGPPGAVGGAALGGAAGGYLKQMIRPPEMKSDDILQRQLQLAEEPAKEGLMMGTGEAAGPVISQAAGKIAPKLGEYANLRAVKTLGGLKKAFSTLDEKGLVQPLGKQLLEDEIVTPFSRPAGIAKKLEGRMGELEGQLQNEIQAADFGREIAQQAGLSQEELKRIESTTFKPKDVAENLKAEIASKYKYTPKEKLQPALDEVDSWLQSQPETMSIGDVQGFKREFNKFLNESDFYRSNPGFKKEGMLLVRKALMKNVEDQANVMAETLGGKSGQVKEINQKLGNYIKAMDIAEDAIARQSANRGISLTDTIAGAAGMGAGHNPLEKSLYAAALAAANKFGRTYGSGILATGANRASQEIQGLGGFLAQPGGGSAILPKSDKLRIEEYVRSLKEKK